MINKNNHKKEEKQIVSIAIPKVIDNVLDKLSKLGIIESKSKFFRESTLEFLDENVNLFKTLEKIQNTDLDILKNDLDMNYIEDLKKE